MNVWSETREDRIDSFEDENLCLEIYLRLYRTVLEELPVSMKPSLLEIRYTDPIRRLLPL